MFTNPYGSVGANSKLCDLVDDDEDFANPFVEQSGSSNDRVHDIHEVQQPEIVQEEITLQCSTIVDQSELPRSPGAQTAPPPKRKTGTRARARERGEAGREDPPPAAAATAQREPHTLLEVFEHDVFYNQSNKGQGSIRRTANLAEWYEGTEHSEQVIISNIMRAANLTWIESRDRLCLSGDGTISKEAAYRPV